MKYLKNLKTSDKISLSFSLFSFTMLVILLFTINITYFFIWYNDQKNQSFYDMEQNYSQSYMPTDTKSAENFKSFLLQSDTIIIPEEGDPICSTGVMLKLHNKLDEVQNKRFYKIDDTLYFIYSREYEGIGKVKVFFDTTDYISTQMTILKISFVVIVFALFFTFFIGKIISQRLLRDLKDISYKLQGVDIDTCLQDNCLYISHLGPENDEIQILVTTLNKSFEKITNQTKNLKQFITDVSHEFKTPLMSMNSRIDVLQRKFETGKLEKQEEEDFFDYLKRQTKRLNTLLETLFLLSRFEESIQKFQRSKVDFSTYLDGKVSTFFDAYPQVSLKKEIQKEVYVEIEDVTCNIIIENLLTNALKFSDTENSKISIGCDEKSFWIEDNGSGISQENVDNLTKKFYKGDRNKEGFGIGLFLVKRIIDIYGFKIAFSSEVGKGLKVQVFFR